MSSKRASSSVAQNASLAQKVSSQDLKSEKQQLHHVPIDLAPTTSSGGKHLESTSHTHTHSHPYSHLSTVGAVGRGGNDVASGRSGEVSVQSSVVIDTVQNASSSTQNKIGPLLAKLRTTTTQMDDYSRRASEQISAAANERIQRVLRETQAAEDALLRDCSSRAIEIENEYNAKLKAFLQELDASKAGNLAALEKDLNLRQQALLDNAKQDMDRIYEQATRQKLGILHEAEAALERDVDSVTDAVRRLGESELEQRLKSKTTTVITTTTDTEAGGKVTSDATPNLPVSNEEKQTSVLASEKKQTEGSKEEHIHLSRTAAEPRGRTRI